MRGTGIQRKNQVIEKRKAVNWLSIVCCGHIKTSELVADSTQGTRITKCVEGLHNKAFILRMGNGSEVFAKLQNPNTGPAHFSVALEVATNRD